MRSGKELLAVGGSVEIFHASRSEVVNGYADGTRRETTGEKLETRRHRARLLQCILNLSNLSS